MNRQMTSPYGPGAPLAGLTVGAALFLFTGVSDWFPVGMAIGRVVSQWWVRDVEIRRDVEALRQAYAPPNDSRQHAARL